MKIEDFQTPAVHAADGTDAGKYAQQSGDTMSPPKMRTNKSKPPQTLVRGKELSNMRKSPQLKPNEHRISTERAYENLANAVIIQAAEDYRLALSDKNSSQIRSLENFFRSSWFGTLTSLDPETLIERLRMEYLKKKSV